MVVWYFILQLPMQSVPITTNVVEFESRSWRGVLDTTISDEVCPVTCSMSVVFFSCTSVSSTNKTDRHGMTEILLKVALSIIHHNPSPIISARHVL